MMNWIKSLTLCAVMLTAATLWGDDALNQFNSAKTAFDNRQYEHARIGFETFLHRFPTHARANEATFFLAESFMFLRQYALAETHFNRLVALGLNDAFSRAALFRIAEIPYIQGQFDIAKPRLEDFVARLPHDVNLQFVLYYLGDIAMRNDVPLEAEWYFEQVNRMFPEGDRFLESQLGLAWAKNRLGKITEANAIYHQLMSSTNPAIVEQATYQWGIALFERGAFEQAINTLTDFQRRFPASPHFADSQRVVARCLGRLNRFEEGLQVLTQLTNATPDDRLMQVRFLYGLNRMQEAKTILDQVKQTAGTLHRDEIALLESVFLFDQRDWRGTIALLESVLVPQFDALNNRMIINYFSLPTAPGRNRLSEEAIFRACSLLTLAYARNGNAAQAEALLREMQGQAALSGNQRLATIMTDTATQLASIGPVPPPRPGGPGGSGGLFANQNNQWTPGTQNQGSRPQTVQTSGTDLERFWNAERLFRTRNFAGAAEQLEQILSGVFNQSVTPPRYIILYNITGAPGTMDENTFARACTLLALAKAQLGDFEQADAILMSLASRIQMGDTVQQNLLRETFDQITELAKSSGGSNIASGSTPGSTPQEPTLTDAEQRRMLRDANSLFRQRRYDQADTRLTELIAHNPSETILTEALLLQSRAKYALGWEQQGVALLERIVDEFPTSPQYPEALWLLGIFYESGGDSFVALEYFQTLVDRFPNFRHIDGALYFVAVDDLTHSSGRRAATLLHRVHRNHRNGLYWSHATWMLAHEAFKRREYAQAERFIQEILRHPPDIAILDRVLFLQGELALRRDDFQTAFLAFREVTQHTPDSPLSHQAMQNVRIAASRIVNVN